MHKVSAVWLLLAQVFVTFPRSFVAFLNRSGCCCEAENAMSRGQKQPSWLRAKTMAEEAQHLSAVKTRKAGLLAETRENENSENAVSHSPDLHLNILHRFNFEFQSW
jgi:hypothetical protein